MDTRHPSLRRHGLLLAAAALVACGGVATRGAATPTPAQPTTRSAATPSAPLPADRVWLLRTGTQRTLDAVDLRSNHKVTSMVAGTIAPDWTRMYSVGVDDNFGTALHLVDPRSGAQLDRVHVDAGMALPDAAGAAGNSGGLSPGGHRLVLAGGPTDTQGHRITSLFRVYDTAALHRAPQAVSLSGDWRFVAVDDSGRNLYLAHWTFSADGSSASSELRRYDLVHATLDPNPVPQSGCTAADNGQGFAVDSLPTADGNSLLSAYTFGDHGPFLQALNLAHGTAQCIALPTGTASHGDVSGELGLLWTMARSHDGNRVVVANVALGVVAVLDGAPPFTLHSATFTPPTASPSPAGWMPFAPTTAEAKRALMGGSALSPDDRVLYAVADNGIAVIDMATLRLTHLLLADQPVGSLALTPDGARLYAISVASSGGFYAVDTAAGAAIAIPEYGDAGGVLRATASP